MTFLDWKSYFMLNNYRKSIKLASLLILRSVYLIFEARLCKDRDLVVLNQIYVFSLEP